MPSEHDKAGLDMEGGASSAQGVASGGLCLMASEYISPILEAIGLVNHDDRIRIDWLL